MARREFIRDAILAASAAGLPAIARASRRTRFTTDPFSLGVASGYPTENSVVLWTRLAPSPLDPGGGMPAEPVEVGWVLAEDEHMHRPVQQGTVLATPQLGHSLHVEPTGLKPDRHYWFRFTVDGAASPVGRTRTAPLSGSPTARLKLAVASCQHYEQGYYAAYRHMLSDDPDLVVHVGDYIYESNSAAVAVRSHGAAEPQTLDEYRARYALYHRDPDLAAMHAACPWVATWDDHEVDNDYAGEVSEQRTEPAEFLKRRAAAYQAYYENMPLPRRALANGPHMTLYTDHGHGDLLSLFMLDQRQYRSPQACPRPGFSGGNRVSGCTELDDHTRTMLGPEQEAWLHARLAASRSRWTLLAQGTVMSHLDEAAGVERRYWTDSWNGYPHARQRLMNTLHETAARNPVILSGDVHSFLVGQLNLRPDDLDSPLIASELVTTSISSLGIPQARLDEWPAINPNILLADSRHRGYLHLDITPARLHADLIGMEDVLRPDSGRKIIRSYVIEDGNPRPIAR